MIALQRTDEFVGRTTNWLYDHLRFLPSYTPTVVCDRLANRQEFADLEARAIDPRNLSRRVWRRACGERLYPLDRIWLKRKAPRVLHSHFGYVAAGDMALAKTLQIPWLVSFYGTDVYQLGYQEQWREIYAAVFERAAKVLALGPAMAARLEKLGCPSDKLDVHLLGIDAAGLPSKARKLGAGEPLRLLFAGTFREKKGIEYVVQGAALAKRAGVPLELHLVGGAMGKPGDLATERAVSRQIRDLGIQDLVTRHGFLSFARLVELALRSHVFVAPSVTATDGDSEGTPFVLQQMMATGMPVIATDHSDIPLLVGDLTRTLVPERDADAIADRIQRFWEDPALLIAEGELLRRRMRDHFEIRQCAAQLANIYDEVLGW
jgi:colanic acid/amylovoran biosynthesis glycosyltransferase